MASIVIAGVHPERGEIFAAIDPAAQYCEAKTAEMRFAALLTPFRDQESAVAALMADGATLADGGR